MKSDTKIFLALGVSAAAVVGLVLWGASRGSGISPSSPQQVVLFPDLKIGDVVLVDAQRALFRSPFAQVVCTVDFVLQDKAVISVRETVPVAPPGEHGTIPRESIVRILSQAPKV